MSDSQNVNLSDFQYKCIRISDAKGLRDLFRETDITALAKQDLIFLLTQILEMSDRHSVMGFADICRDELNNRRTNFVSWSALVISIISVLVAALEYAK